MVTITNDKGSIRIATEVFTSLAGAAAVNCFGVRGMAMRSMSDGLVHLLKREVMGKGVKVLCDEDGTITIRLHIIVKTGINIPAICNSIINEVRYMVSKDTGVEVKAVDVYIDGIMPD